MLLCFHQFLRPQQEALIVAEQNVVCWKIWFSLLRTGATKSKEAQNMFVGTVTEL